MSQSSSSSAIPRLLERDATQPSHNQRARDEDRARTTQTRGGHEAAPDAREALLRQAQGKLSSRRGCTAGSMILVLVSPDLLFHQDRYAMSPPTQCGRRRAPVILREGHTYRKVKTPWWASTLVACADKDIIGLYSRLNPRVQAQRSRGTELCTGVPLT